MEHMLLFYEVSSQLLSCKHQTPLTLYLMQSVGILRTKFTSFSATFCTNKTTVQNVQRKLIIHKDLKDVR